MRKKCSITGMLFENEYDNHNAWPYSGRCCGYANSHYVIPARCAGVPSELIKEYGGNKAFAKLWDECETIDELINILRKSPKTWWMFKAE